MRLPQDPFLRSVALYAPGRALPAAANLVLTVVAARWLDPSDLGAFSILIGIVLLAGGAAGGWLEQSAIRDLGTVTAGDRRLGNHLIVLLATSAAAGAVGFGVFLLALPRVGLPSLALASMSLVALVAFAGTQAVFMARMRSREYLAMEVGRAMVNLALGTILLAAGFRGPAPLLMAFLGGNLVALAPGLVRSGLFSRPGSRTELFAYGRSAAAYGSPLVLWFLGSQVLLVLGRIVLGFTHPLEEAGRLHVASQVLPAALNVAVAPVLLSAHPLILRASDTAGRAAARVAVARFTAYFLLVSLPLGAALVATAPAAIALLFGSAYAGATTPARLLVVAGIGWSLGMLAHKPFEIERRTRAMLVPLAAAVAVVTVGHLVLVPTWGATGAAVSVLVGSWSYPVVAATYAREPVDWARLRGPVALAFSASVAAWGAAEAVLYVAGAGWLAVAVALVASFAVAAPLSYLAARRADASP